MKINFSKEEYRNLLDIIYAGIMVINGNRAPEDYFEEYEEMEQYIYSFAKDYGLENLVGYDDKYKRYFTTQEFDEEKIKDLIEEYDDIIFWSMLSFNLAKRDAHRELNGKTIDRKTLIKSILEKEAAYNDEFYENGLEGLELNKAKAIQNKDSITNGTLEAKERVIQLKITVKNLNPPFWRRVLVKEDTSFESLNKIIQTAMGWSGYHLYRFKIMGDEIGDASEIEFWNGEAEILDSKKTNLKDYNFMKNDKFEYIYDFGDYWEHEVLVEGLLAVDDGEVHPICIKGKRNCPPEDVGGPLGYKEFLEAINDTNNINHEEMLKWAGGDFDAEEFDLDKINEILKDIQ